MSAPKSDSPVMSKVNPGGQTQVNEPSVFTQVPPPRHSSLLSSHSFISLHIFPSTYIKMNVV